MFFQEASCLCEDSALLIEGFKLSVAPGGRGRGVALYIREDIYKKKVKDIVIINEENVQAIIILFTSFLLAGVYVPPKADMSQVVPSLQLEKHTEKREKCLVVGDFNFDFSSEEKHPIRTQMTSLKYEQLMKYPSHYAGSVLDMAYKKGKWDILKDKKLLCAYSDHFGLSVSIAKKVLTK